MVAGTIRETDTVNVSFDDARYDCATSQVDHSRLRTAGRRRVADGDETSVADGNRAGNRIAGIHRVESAVRQNQLLHGRCDLAKHFDYSGSGPHRRCGGEPKKTPSRWVVVLTRLVTHISILWQRNIAGGEET